MKRDINPNTSSNLAIRTLSAIAMILVALAAVYLGGWPFRLLVGVAAGAMLAEYSLMHRLSHAWLAAALALLAINLWALPEWANILIQTQSMAVRGFGYGLGVAIVFACALGLLARSGKLAQGYLYIAIPSLAALALARISQEILLWAMIVTWTTDIGAYFAGRAIGGPRLAPAISPAKTWAGLAGGVGSAALSGWFAAHVSGLGPGFLYSGAGMALLAQAGDLYESSLKRKAGVKDSGALLPGHGGVLDRLDGLLPVALAAFILAVVTGAGAA